MDLSRPHGDWHAFGQRQTDSGAISFTDVLVSDDELFLTPGPFHDAFSTLRTSLVHLFLANTYLGITDGAFAAALALTRSREAPFVGAGVTRIAEDPLVLRRIGALAVDLRAAQALFQEAAVLMQRSWEAGHDLTPELRGETDAAVSTAKVATAENGLRITAGIFELTGARSTGQALALDRFWRNLRVHSLHDPVDQRLRDLGRQTLTGAAPAIAPKA